MFIRLLYYPPIIVDEVSDNYAHIKGSSTYCHQKMNFDESKIGSLDISKDDKDEEQHVKDTDMNKTVTRCGEHCDYGTFTLLVQDAEGGLEVQLPNSEKWQRVGHLPGAGKLLCEQGEDLHSLINLISSMSHSICQCW